MARSLNFFPAHGGKSLEDFKQGGDIIYDHCVFFVESGSREVSRRC